MYSASTKQGSSTVLYDEKTAIKTFRGVHETNDLMLGDCVSHISGAQIETN